MNILKYLGGRKGEFLLVLISAWAVSSVAINGFFLDGIVETYGYVARLGLTLVLDAVLCFVLYVAAGTKGVHTSGIVMYIVVAAVCVMGAFAMSGGDSLYVDAEGNYLYLALVLIISCAACFLLTRTLPGSMVWFVASTFTCSLIQAFYLCEELPLSIVAAISALALIVYRNFYMGVQGAQLGGMKAQHFALPASVVPVLCAAGIALVAWFAIIAPLNPGVVDIKLITEYKRLPIQEYVGTAQEQPQLNYDMTSDQLVEGEMYTTDDLWVDPDATKEVEATSILEQLMALGIMGTGSGSSSGSGTITEPEENNNDHQFDPFSYAEDFAWLILWIVIALLVIALIVGFFLWRRKRRTRRLVGYLEKSPTDQVILIYRFLYERLRRLGFVRPEGMTLREYATTSARSMDMLTEETGVSFQYLTEVYVACVYGDYVPTEDDVVPFVTYYLRFWKAARTYLGKTKYFFKSFRL